jgi:ATP-binding cassette subfamily B protein
MSDHDDGIPASAASLGARLSARLRPRRGTHKIPYVAQLERTDCGAACLTMLLRMHGSFVELRDIREQLGIGRDGASARRIAEVARAHGFAARGVQVDVEELRLLPRGTILHWGFRHFVVLDGVRRDGIDIVDPSCGRRRVGWGRVRRELTGVAIIAEPCESFVGRSRRRGSPLSVYLRQIFDETGLLARTILLSVMLRLAALGAPMLTAVVVEQVVPRADRDLLWTVMLGLLLVHVFVWLANVTRSHMLLQLRTVLDVRMNTGFIQRLVSLPYGFFQAHSTGDLLTRIASNGAIREVLSATTLSAVLDGAFAAVYLALICANDLVLGAIATGLGLAQALAYWLVRRRMSDLNREVVDAQTASQAYIIQALAGMETLKCAGAEQHAVERWTQLFADELEIGVRSGRLSGRHSASMDALTSGSPLVLMAYGAIAVMDGSMGLGTMLALQTLAIGFLSPLAGLVRSALAVQQLDVHLERIDDVLSAQPEQAPGREYREIAPTGAIRVENVSFRYSDDAPLAVTDVSLEIAAGSSVAIVGRSGSGKSTLAKLLLGLYDVESGTIRYDGCDLADLDHVRLRRMLGVVSQSPYIFDGTVRQNIALNDPDAPLAAVIAAALAAAVHDEIDAMPLGYETPVAEGGGSISGGQRLRIALARALLHDPRIVLLDEATSQVDQRAERVIMDNLARLRCTRIIIAHRMSTIAFADRILVMDQGRVVESGTHGELMARMGHYFRLVSAVNDERPADPGVYRDQAT